MRIAVTYDNGQIFQHFGRTENFKVYEVENGAVVSSEIIGSNGSGHGALAGVLSGEGIDVLICGGIGGGAQNALMSYGIEICSGAQGSCDAAVEAYLAGTLENAGVTCHHHDHEHEEGHECHCGGHHEEGHDCSCGGHEEGGCHCGGGAPELLYEGPNAGKKVSVHYTGTFNDGTRFDSSLDRGEPLEFVCGVGMMIPGFDAAVAKMQIGEKIDIHLLPEEAYGPKDPSQIFTVDVNSIPGAGELTVGQQVYLQDQSGQYFPVLVADRYEDNITFDANHEMAGKELNFSIELLSAE